MRIIVLSLSLHFYSLILCNQAFAQSKSETSILNYNPHAKTQSPKQQALKNEENSLKKLKSLAEGDGEKSVVAFAYQPTIKTCSSITYKLPEQKKMRPGETIYFSVPTEFQSRSASTILLDHRQEVVGKNEELLAEENKTGKRAWDHEPGLTSVQMHLKGNTKDPWRYYQASYGESGKYGSKFAEIGHSPERETLEGLRTHGHRGVKTGAASKEALLLDAVKVVSTGKDDVLLSAITVKFEPPSTKKIEHVFTPGTQFEDVESGSSARYGGGERQGGNYKDAIRLGGSPNETTTLPNGWQIVGNELHIPAPSGMHVSGVEVAVGDMHNDDKPHKDGGTGSSGWARLSMSLKKASGQQNEVFMTGENVGKNDSMMGLPSDCSYRALPGDKIIIRAQSDVAHIMGVRLHLDK